MRQNLNQLEMPVMTGSYQQSIEFVGVLFPWPHKESEGDLFTVRLVPAVSGLR